MGAQIAREVAKQTNKIAGDGTTTAVVLASALIQEGLPAFDGTTNTRSQIFREFVSDAGSGSGILRLRRTILLLFGKKKSKTLCLDSFIKIMLLNRRGSVCLRTF
jgi:hypothetical protein